MVENKLIKGDTFDNNLKCRLTLEEVAAYAEKLAKACNDLRESELERKEKIADLNDAKSICEKEIAIFSRRVDSKEEWRDVPCHWFFDFGKGTKKLIREDTGEVIAAEVKVSDNDRQKMLKVAPIKLVKKGDGE